MFTRIEEAQMAASILASVLASTLDDTDIDTYNRHEDGEAVLWEVRGSDPANSGKKAWCQVHVVGGVGGWQVRVTRGSRFTDGADDTYDILHRVNDLSDLPSVVASILGVD